MVLIRCWNLSWNDWWLRLSKSENCLAFRVRFDKANVVMFCIAWYFWYLILAAIQKNVSAVLVLNLSDLGTKIFGSVFCLLLERWFKFQNMLTIQRPNWVWTHLLNWPYWGCLLRKRTCLLFFLKSFWFLNFSGSYNMDTWKMPIHDMNCSYSEIGFLICVYCGLVTVENITNLML